TGPAAHAVRASRGGRTAPGTGGSAGSGSAGTGRTAGADTAAADPVRQPAGPVLHRAIATVAGRYRGARHQPVTRSWGARREGGVFRPKGSLLVRSCRYAPRHPPYTVDVGKREVRPLRLPRTAAAGAGAADCRARTVAHHIC